MGDDDPLERQLEQNTEGRERPLLVPGRHTHGARRQEAVRPSAKTSVRCSEARRSFIAAAAVVKRDDPAWEPAFRLDRLELALGNVSAPERLGPNGRAR